MNFFNRLLVVLELILVIVVSLALVALLLVGRSTLQNLVGPTLARLSDVNLNASQLICIGILVLVAALALLLMILEVYPRGTAHLRLTSIQGAEVLLTSDAITSQLEYALDSVTDVIRVRPRVLPTKRGEGVDVFVELWTTADVDVAAKTQEVTGIARQVLEDRLGLKVGRIQIKLDQMRQPPKKAVVRPAAKAVGGEFKS